MHGLIYGLDKDAIWEVVIVNEKPIIPIYMAKVNVAYDGYRWYGQGLGLSEQAGREAAESDVAGQLIRREANGDSLIRREANGDSRSIGENK
jgi:hypothetical protein